MKRKWVIRISVAIGIVALIWTVLTVWVEIEGPSKLIQVTGGSDSLQVLVVYDPDPIYNLDEQICLSIAKGLNDEHINATVATVRATRELDMNKYSSVVLCANTYNWAPDAAITAFVRSNKYPRSLPVVAVTVGPTVPRSAKELLVVASAAATKFF